MPCPSRCGMHIHDSHHARPAAACVCRTGIDSEGYMLPMAEIGRRASEARALGATEVCIQAGLPPNMKPDLYERYHGRQAKLTRGSPCFRFANCTLHGKARHMYSRCDSGHLYMALSCNVALNAAYAVRSRTQRLACTFTHSPPRRSSMGLGAIRRMLRYVLSYIHKVVQLQYTEYSY